MRIVTPAIYAALLGGAIYIAISQNPLPNAIASAPPEGAKIAYAVPSSSKSSPVQRVGRLGHESHRAGRGEPADPGQGAGQRVALDVLHDEERGAALVAVVVDVDDAGVVDRRHCARLATEPL